MRLLSRSGLLALAAGALVAVPATAQQRTLTYYGDFDPAPLAAFQTAIAEFEKANPDIDVVFQNFDHEGYKTAIRNFLTADPPDIANWYAGNRMAPFVNGGQFMDVSDVWAEHGLAESLASALPSMTLDGKQWGVPYTYYQWGIYFNRTLYDQVGAEVPSTWDEFIANCAKFKEAGIDCVTTGTKALWPAAGIFDYLDLRTNGYDFHMALTNGEVPWTDDRVKATFSEWAKLVEPGYVVANHAAVDWQDAAALLVQGKAANFVIGNFAVPYFKDGGMTDETLGFMPFPTITPDVPRAELAPIELGAHHRRRQEPRRRQEVPRLSRHGRGADQDQRGVRPAADQQGQRSRRRSVPPGGLRAPLDHRGRHRAVLRPRRAGRDGQDRHGGLPAVHDQAGQARRHPHAARSGARARLQVIAGARPGLRLRPPPPTPPPPDGGPPGGRWPWP